jgi:hypothetical protein
LTLADINIGLATVVTLVGVFAIAAVLAAYLIIISLILREVSFNVGTVLIGVRAIANQCAPLGPVIRDILGDVRAIEEELEALLGGTPSRRARARR